MIDEALIGERFRALAPELSERGRRIWAASEARVLGRGGIAAVSRASGISPNTIRRGMREIDAGERLQEGRVRRRGGGRKPIAQTDPALLEALEALVAEDCRGDPMQVLLWTSKSVRKLAGELRERGHEAHYTTVAGLLRSLGYSLQSNRKTLEGAQHPVGITAETAQLAVASIRAWWQDLGRARYPHATALQITADCGGGNGNRTRLWKLELQKLADQTALQIRVCHFPPGTSKWNKIEHRLFCHITQNWRGRPLESYEVVINSIAATTTSKGLKVYARLDERDYPKKIQVTDADLAAVNLKRDEFHPEWNYSIAPPS